MPVQAYLTNGQQLVYDNDVNGNRVRNTISGTSDNFYFNGADGKTEVVSLVAHGSNLIYNILGAGGDNIGQVKVVSASPTRYYYLKDHLGSIKVTVNTSGTVVGYDDYYPYGMVMTGRSLTASEDGRYKFTGKERDASTGLDYFGARYYDSWNGRLDQVDQLADDHPCESPYVYCSSNPINIVDDDGMEGHVVKDANGNPLYYEMDQVDVTGKQDRNYISGWVNWRVKTQHAINLAYNLGYSNDNLHFVNTTQGTRWYREIPKVTIGVVDLPGMPGLTPLLVGEVALSTGEIIELNGLTDHALARMNLRGFSEDDVLNIIKNGNVEHTIGPKYNTNQLTITLDNNQVVIEAEGRQQGKIITVYNINVPGGHK